MTIGCFRQSIPLPNNNINFYYDCLYINQKVQVACDLNFIVKSEGLQSHRLFLRDKNHNMP